MSLSIGIVGLPNVGKSSLFNALTSNQALAANYPFATIEPNVGIVAVPDGRLRQIAGLYPGAPIVPADVKFTDIAGLVSGAHQGEGLGNQFLANIRETAAIAHVVRAFNDTNVTHVNNEIDPAADIVTINTELILADLDTLTSRFDTLRKNAKADPKLMADCKLVEELLEALDNGQGVKEYIGKADLNEYLQKADVSSDTAVTIKQLLTAKPVIYVFNVDEKTLIDESEKTRLSEVTSNNPSVFICAKLEAELSQLPHDEASELLTEYGQSESGLTQLIHQAYKSLGLQSFFTAGEKEVKAWTIKAGMKAPAAAGTIHTDFERGFIAAEIINWHDLVKAGSKAAAKTKGLIRTEGKDYHMRDGDVAEFRFNV